MLESFGESLDELFVGFHKAGNGLRSLIRD